MLLVPNTPYFFKNRFASDLFSDDFRRYIYFLKVLNTIYMPHNYFLSDSEMANIVMNEDYGFNYEWIAAGSGLGEEICGVDKDCIVPSGLDLPKIEQIETQEVDGNVEIQVLEEEVVTDQWDTHHAGSEEDGLHFRVDPSQDGLLDPLIIKEEGEEEDDDDSELPFPCEYCSHRFSSRLDLATHEKQTHMNHECNLCGLRYPDKAYLLEHIKVHAYIPMKIGDSDEEYRSFKKVKTKKKSGRKKKNSRKYEFDEPNIVKKVIAYDNLKFEIEYPQKSDPPPKFPVLNERKPYVCQHCGVGFAREKALTSHTMVHIGDSAFECDRCGEMFQSEEHLEKHNTQKHGHLSKKRDDNHATFQCHECGTAFQWYNQLKKHQKTHLKTAPAHEIEEPQHLCTLCDVAFSSISELVAHKQDHDPDYGVQSCYFCGQGYEALDDLKQHLLEKHKADHMCDFCDKFFRDPKTLARHLTAHIDSRSYPCSLCSRRFHSKAKLKRHIAAHDENKPGSALVCRDCNELFDDGPSLLNHRQHIHGVNISRMFPCLQCGKAFNSRSSHQIHLRIHTGERPYGCKYCWKAFGDGGTLRKHERIHTGEKPYVCPVCSKAFNQRVVLREHIRAHHSGTENRMADNSYECSVCGSVLSTSSELCAHLVLHSDENTAKHRTPKGARKYVRKKKFLPTGFEDDSGSAEEDRRQLPQPPPPPPQPAHVVRITDPFDNTLNKLEQDIALSNISDLKGRARIVRSGKRGIPKGQNKRYARGKTKASRLLNNSSYASKYVVSQPEMDQVSNEIAETSPPSPPFANGIPSRNRPRTKNVSYHNFKTEPRYELATFPVEKMKTPTHTSKKRKASKRESPPDTVDNQYVNGIDLFEEAGEEQIETCIVDDIDVELKLEVKASESEEGFFSPEIMIKSELVSCDMCSEMFTSRSELLKHIQIHI